MKKSAFVLIPLCVAALGCGGTEAGDPGVLGVAESSIVNGTRDQGAHPSTGALVAFRASVNAVMPRCSGTLISPTIFLTAAHCAPVAPNGIAEVTFEDVFVHGSSKTYTGSYVAHPEFGQAQSDSHDIAVVIFNSPIPGITPAGLPSAGMLEALPRDQQFTSVGYGAQSVGPEGSTQDGARWTAVGTLNATNPAWLHLSQNAATDDGGTCFGDSGGPNFLGAGADETTVIAGITIKGDGACVATNVIYRLDTASARAFLGHYVPLP